MQYGKFFKEARKRSGLSQKQVAQKLNIHQSNISDWENDISRPEYEKLTDFFIKIKTLTAHLSPRQQTMFLDFLKTI